MNNVQKQLKHLQKQCLNKKAIKNPNYYAKLEFVNANLKFNDELNKKLQEAEMDKQIIEEQAKQSGIEDVQMFQYVQRMIKMFDPNQDDKQIIKYFEKVIKNSKEINAVLTQEDALQQTIVLMRQPKQHPRKSKNTNPQQVSKVIS